MTQQSSHTPRPLLSHPILPPHGGVWSIPFTHSTHPAHRQPVTFTSDPMPVPQLAAGFFLSPCVHPHPAGGSEGQGRAPPPLPTPQCPSLSAEAWSWMTLRPTLPGLAALQPPPPPTTGTPVSLQLRPLILPNPAGPPLPALPPSCAGLLAGCQPNFPADGGFLLCFCGTKTWPHSG